MRYHLAVQIGTRYLKEGGRRNEGRSDGPSHFSLFEQSRSCYLYHLPKSIRETAL
jgi:hypothetical protein